MARHGRELKAKAAEAKPPDEDEIRTEADPHAIPPEMDPADYPAPGPGDARKRDADGTLVTEYADESESEGGRPASNPGEPATKTNDGAQLNAFEPVPPTNAELVARWREVSRLEAIALANPPPEVIARIDAEDKLARKIHESGGPWQIGGKCYAGRKPREQGRPWYLDPVPAPKETF